MKFTKIIGFAPDLPPTTPGTLLYGSNALLPTTRGIGPAPIFDARSSGAINANPCGYAQLAKADGTLRRYMGTNAKLWEFDGTTTVTDRSGAAYGAGNSHGWSFAQFGDVSLASNYANTIQKSTGAAFSDLSGAPKASIICNVGPPSAPFIMALGYDDGTATPDGWFCSGISDYTTWNSAAAQSINGRLLEPTGPFTAAVPFRDGILAWKADAMYRGEYVGSPVVWAWTRIASKIGCCAKNMATVVNDVAYFADKHGFWMYDGSYPQQVPGYCNDFWRNVVADTSSYQVDDTCQMIFDPVRHTIWVSYTLSGNYLWLHYNIVSKMWTHTSVPLTKASENMIGIIAFEPLCLAVGTPSNKVLLGTFLSLSSGTANYVVPKITTWYEGDPENYVVVDRVIPYFIAPPGYIGLGNLVTVASTCQLMKAGNPGITAITAGSSVALDLTNYKFDVMASDHFISATITIVGLWEMTHIGMSATPSGTSGKR